MKEGVSWTNITFHDIFLLYSNLVYRYTSICTHAEIDGFRFLSLKLHSFMEGVLEFVHLEYRWETVYFLAVLAGQVRNMINSKQILLSNTRRNTCCDRDVMDFTRAVSPKATGATNGLLIDGIYLQKLLQIKQNDAMNYQTISEVFLV